MSNSLITKLRNAKKAVVAFCGVVALAAPVIADADVTSTKGIITCIVALCTVFGVYKVTNRK